jgi:U3 small nucleolar RNA-associated protein 21
LTLDSLRVFINAITRRLLSHRDFEAVQTFQNVFLHIHAETIIADVELKQSLEYLMNVQRAESERILGLVASSLGTLSFMRDIL